MALENNQELKYFKNFQEVIGIATENKVKRVLVMPVEKADFITQLKSILEQVKSRISKEKAAVLQLSFFVEAKNNETYLDLRNTVLSNTQSMLGFKPAISIIAQTPANGNRISLELILLSDKTQKAVINYKEVDGYGYTLVNSKNTSEVYIGGISPKNLNSDFTQQVDEAFAGLQEILKQEKFTFSDILRQWNYVEGILKINDKQEEILQNYQVLNDIRSRYYGRHDFTNGYPAATGIGMDAGGIILEAYAAKQTDGIDIIPVKNPRQTDAYHYSGNVLIGDAVEKRAGKSTPKFERAKYISINRNKYIFISGTASIQKEHTLGIGDVRMQTEITLDNIANLISPDNLKNSDISVEPCSVKYSFIRVYIKKKKDLNLVREICDTYYGDIPIHYLLADICRDNLLLEIEGVAELIS